MKVEIARLETLPKLAAELVKPAEKIDSIRIHQMSGLGGATGTGGNGADKPVVNQALDSILGMAVQLPAMKKIGEELGISLENGLDTARSEAPADSKPALEDTAPEDADDAAGTSQH